MLSFIPKKNYKYTKYKDDNKNRVFTAYNYNYDSDNESESFLIDDSQLDDISQSQSNGNNTTVVKDLFGANPNLFKFPDPEIDIDDDFDIEAQQKKKKPKNNYKKYNINKKSPQKHKKKKGIRKKTLFSKMINYIHNKTKRNKKDYTQTSVDPNRSFGDIQINSPNNGNRDDKINLVVY